MWEVHPVYGVDICVDPNNNCKVDSDQNWVSFAEQMGVDPSETRAIVVGVPIVLILGYLAFNFDSGTADPSTLNGVQITFKDTYQSHVKNNTGIILKSLTMTCSPGGDAQPVTSITGLYPPLQPGYGEDAYISGNCRLVRVNESHQLW